MFSAAEGGCSASRACSSARSSVSVITQLSFDHRFIRSRYIFVRASEVMRRAAIIGTELRGGQEREFLRLRENRGRAGALPRLK